MKIEALIEFNKYTLAITAGAFVYALEKLSPMPTELGRWFLLAVMLVLLLSAGAGILVFARATKIKHQKETVEGGDSLIKKYGGIHATALLVGLLALGGALVHRVMSPPAAPSTACQCKSLATK